MIRINPEALANYLHQDPVARAWTGAQGRWPETVSQRWLNESPPKRLIFHRLYADLIEPPAGPATRRLLDVGGGLTAFTPMMAAANHLILADPLYHENAADIAALTDGQPVEWHCGDWYQLGTGVTFDVIVANDLFPNVDQRLALFIDWALPRAREVRLSLTFHQTPRWYPARRTGADEQLTMLAFDGARTRAALSPHASRIAGWDPALFDGDEGSVFPNGRQVVCLTLEGDVR